MHVAEPERGGVTRLEETGDAPEIGVRATIGPGQKVPEWRRFQVHVDGKDLALALGDHYTGEFRVTCVSYVSGWGPGVVNTTPVKLNLTESQRDELTRTGMDVVLERPVEQAARKVRVVVQDSTTGATGPVTIPLR